MRKLLLTILLLLSPSLAHAVITDDFNRAALGANWAAAQGTIWAENTSTTVRPVSAYVRTAIVRTEAAFPSDQYAQVDTRHVTASDGGVGGVMVRSDGSSTYYYAALNPGVGATAVSVFKCVVGVCSELGDSTTTYAADTTHTIKLDASGSATTTLTLYVNSVSKATITDSSSPITSGKPGLFAFTGDQKPDHDNFESTNATSAATLKVGPLLGVGN